MEGDDFLDKSSQGCASKSKGAKFMRPLPVTPKAKKIRVVASVSKSADLTTVAGKLIKTDDCLQPSRDVSSTENQKGSQ